LELRQIYGSFYYKPIEQPFTVDSLEEDSDPIEDNFELS